VSGVYVLNEKFQVIDEINFKENKLLEKNLQLKSLKWIDEEKNFVKKYNGEKLIFLGFKNEKLNGIKVSQDINKLRRIPLKIKWEKNYKVSAFDLKNSFNRDILTIQAVRSFDDLDRIFHGLTMRIRDWYDLYLPEISRNIADNEEFIPLISENKQKLSETVGFIDDKKDINEIIDLANLAMQILKERAKVEKYIEKLMGEQCTNLKDVAGAVLGARLLSLAGSIRRLATMPYTTLQLLGAEKALFRHLRAHKKCPKHGVIISHNLIASAKHKGRASRLLAEKISIAVRVDFFKGEYIADKLNKELNKKLKDDKN
jgi:nucleolar protein 56